MELTKEINKEKQNFMNQRIIDFCNSYKDKVKDISEKYSSEQDKMQEEIKYLERYTARRIARAKLTDEEKMEMMDLFTTEDAKVSIVLSLKKDANKAKGLEQVHDQRDLVRIINTIDDDTLKLETLKYVISIRDKAKIFVTLKDIEKILSFLEENSDMKNAVVKYLKGEMKYSPKEYWDFMKNADLQNQIIPHILFDSKYRIISHRDMDDSMREDIEKYLGKPLPENIEEMSIYEMVGVDLDVLQGEVVTSEAQLRLNKFQKMYFHAINDRWGAPKKDEPKRKISIRNFGGSFCPTLAEGIQSPENWKELLMGLKRMGENIEKHSEGVLFDPELNDNMEALGLRCINGKYYTYMNGNHRMTLLKAKYLSEVNRANGDTKRLAEIEEKYTIEASYVTELPSNANELMGICILGIINGFKDYSIKIEELTEEGRKAGYIINNGAFTTIIKSEQELQQYLQRETEALKTIDEGQVFEEFNKKIQTLNLDCPENEEYRRAFEVMTGISLEQEKKQEDSKIGSSSINEFGEIIRENVEDAKMPKGEQPEMTKPMEGSFRDEICSNDDIQDKKQKGNRKNNVNLWMNRYKTYNSAIDRVPQKLKAKFIQIRSNIINAIKTRLKERNNQERGHNTSERS